MRYRELLRIISWNILHIEHEINHVGNESLVLRKYSDEKMRMKLIIDKLQNFLNDSGRVVILLQEVPTDYLVKMKEQFTEICVTIIHHSYLPMNKSHGIYENPTENLVILLKGVDFGKKSVIEFEKGKKSAIKVSFPWGDLFNVHMPFGCEKLRNSLRLLQLGKSPFLIGGDFNENPEFLEKQIEIYDGKVIKNDIPTHRTIHKGKITDKIYDHFVTNTNLFKVQNFKVDLTDLSDHCPIILDIEIF